ncbi:MAG: LysM peptidoglycan-binding domain-containing protein [Thermodesulfovibrionales bacterium]|nr:LysM peptidoglycan-binding domain-containing protein [Thermodesulfovibrionales bacterium]
MKEIIITFLIALFSIISISVSSEESFATANNDLYIVKKGDTLYSISKKFKIPVSDIMEANNLSTDRLSIGMKLILNKNKPITQSRNSSEGRQINTTPSFVSTHADPFEVRYHKVKKGESIEKIAKKYSLTVEKIKEINGLKTTKLKVGQQLLIRTPKPEIHIVKKGDNLWNISVRYGINPEELKEINGLKDNSLKIGQKLLLTKKSSNSESDSQLNQLTHDQSKVYASPLIQKVEEVKELAKSDELSGLSLRERLIVFAKKMMHLPYRFGGNSPFGIDCSAYVQKVYSLIGLNLPRSAREQFRLGEEVKKDELAVGDLVFFRTYASFPSHVGIYLGNNLFIHASSKTKKVTIDSLETPYYLKRFIGAKKIISEEDIAIVQSENKAE